MNEEEVEKLKNESWIMSNVLKTADIKLQKMAEDIKSLKTKGLGPYDLVCLIYGRNTSLTKGRVHMVIDALLHEEVDSLETFLDCFTKGYKVQEINAVIKDLNELIETYTNK